MMPIGNGNLDQKVLGTFHFAQSLHAGLQSGQSGRTRSSQTEQSFSRMKDFGKAQKLTVCHKHISKMFRQLTGQISAHYSSSEARNTHLCLFCTVASEIRIIIIIFTSVRMTVSCSYNATVTKSPLF